MISIPENISAFALLVDKMRSMNESDLRLMYVRLVKEELEKEWAQTTSEADFQNVTDEEIVAVIQKKRYGN